MKPSHFVFIGAGLVLVADVVAGIQRQQTGAANWYDTSLGKVEAMDTLPLPLWMQLIVAGLVVRFGFKK